MIFKHLKMNLKYSSIILFTLISSMTQLTAQSNVTQKAIQSSKYWLDIDYVGDRIMGHRLDIHLPQVGKDRYPVVICIYGSAWFSNSSKAATFQNGIGQHLLDNGFAVVSINHRSSHDGKFPVQIQDVKAAIRFVRANAASYSLDDSFIGITGWSSGGHLSTFAGVTNGVDTYAKDGMNIDIEGDLGSFTETSSKVDAVVDWFGPTDFLIMDECGSSFSHDEAKSPESSLIGGAIQENPVACGLANPVTYVKEDNPPFLIFHGDQDPLVPHCQSEKLFEAMQKAGTESKLVIVEGGKHGPGVMIEQYYQQMTDFFKSHASAGQKLPDPQLEFLYEATVTLDPPREVGKTKYGVRRIIGINGGTFAGPKMKGVVLPGGADWQTVRADGTADLVANYSLLTDDGVIIYIENKGIRTAPREVLQRLAKGEEVSPSEYYMRTSATFEVSEESKYNWLNKLVVISTGMRKANSVILKFYKVL